MPIKTWFHKWNEILLYLLVVLTDFRFLCHLKKLWVTELLNFTEKNVILVLPFQVLILKITNIQQTSLVAQWLRIRLPMQGTRVWALVREDPTRRGATKPVRHNYWAWALEPVSHNYWACEPQLLKTAGLEPVLRNKRSHRNEKPAHRNEE